MEKIETRQLTTQLGRFLPCTPAFLPRVQFGLRSAVARSGLLALLLAGVVSSGCSSSTTSDIQIHTAADNKADLTGYKSFAWYASGALLHDRTGVWVPKDADTQSEVEFLVDKGLREKGLSVAQEHPDLFVSLMIVADVQEVQELKKTRGEGLTTFDPVGQGALVVELIDAETGKTVWLGGAEGEVRQSRSPEESKQRLAYAVDKIFAQLPR